MLGRKILGLLHLLVLPSLVLGGLSNTYIEGSLCSTNAMPCNTGISVDGDFCIDKAGAVEGSCILCSGLQTYRQCLWTHATNTQCVIPGSMGASPPCGLKSPGMCVLNGSPSGASCAPDPAGTINGPLNCTVSPCSGTI